MTALMTYRPCTEQTVRRAPGARSPAARGNPINAACAVLRPLVATVGIIAAGAAASLAPAHADPPSGPFPFPSNNAGPGNSGPLNNALAGIGQSICPMLVKPGATVASIASQLVGNSGLSPGMAGFVATMAIQMGCPGFMTSLANGKMPDALQGLGGNPALPIPMQSPGAGPAPGMPFSPPGAGPAPGMPFSPPGAGPATAGMIRGSVL